MFTGILADILNATLKKLREFVFNCNYLQFHLHYTLKNY
ncbi:hypothetical protein C900_02772 [Fulvivirga imtechensis AK7]|uniref:Uncharacterized protein n=1 Tax=Fulvivirga imtechensis AK7 TaxID=1237149 RepID=L8JR27_9BACT|nr:hypothetical protein C900_02772 [Fulvivirga imtechensis AK7]